MLALENQGKHAAMAFALAHYLVDRNRPAPMKTRQWLERIIPAFRSPDASADKQVITAALLLRATDPLEGAPWRARRYLLAHGLDPEQQELEPEAIPGFAAVLAPGWDGDDFLELVKEARTPGEQVANYLLAADAGETSLSYPRLRESRHWTRLSKGLLDAKTRQRFQIVDHRPTACPECHSKLPRSSVEELMSHGVTSCCHLILSTEI
jgi:hypothetical protein